MSISTPKLDRWKNLKAALKEAETDLQFAEDPATVFDIQVMPTFIYVSPRDGSRKRRPLVADINTRLAKRLAAKQSLMPILRQAVRDLQDEVAAAEIDARQEYEDLFNRPVPPPGQGGGQGQGQGGPN